MRRGAQDKQAQNGLDQKKPSSSTFKSKPQTMLPTDGQHTHIRHWRRKTGFRDKEEKFHTHRRGWSIKIMIKL